MRVCGIIAEYDPFHSGHRHQLKSAREQSGAEYVVAVIGCAFSQRGEAMLFSTQARAEMALRSGADLVLGMPVSFSCAQANRFARGGVGILHSLGPVTHLSFGCEQGFAAHLAATAELLHRPSPAFIRRLKAGLEAGLSFAAAQGEALGACLAQVPPRAFSAPNFILGVSYLAELARLGSGIRPLPIPRGGDYHAKGLSGLPSATAVRAALLQGNWPGVRASVPEESLAVIRPAVERAQLHRPGALDALVIARLMEAGEQRLLPSPEMSEGLEKRIAARARQAASRQELIDLVKTRRYPRSRVSRAVNHGLMGLTSFPDRPGYARLLGFRKRAAPLLKAIKSGGFPLIDRPGHAASPDFSQDMRAEELWALGAGLPPASAWQHLMIVLDEGGTICGKSTYPPSPRP